MRQSELFTKTRKEAPAGEVSKNAELLIRGGFIDKLQAGVYSYLPLGFRVLQKIEAIIREEMNKLGGQEILMPALHPKENWLQTGRWNTLDVLYKIKDGEDREMALSPTHEEVVVPLVKQFVSSYKDLPLGVYQFQDKFRMELRPKSGILRGREFRMKDFYSFHRDETDLAAFYNSIKKVYKTIFDRVGIGARTHLTYASGGTFSKYSHEFQTLAKNGEDTIFLCECGVAVNEEIRVENPACPECGGKKFTEERAIEVGNIFELKTKFSEPFKLTYKDEKGELRPVVMGCYGIGLGRVMGTIVETLSDEKGIIWPATVAPFRVHLTALAGDDASVISSADALYRTLQERGIEVLYDDRDISAGVKLADADLLGMPLRVVVSRKTLAENGAELKSRGDEKVRIVKFKDLLDELK